MTKNIIIDGMTTGIAIEEGATLEITDKEGEYLHKWLKMLVRSDVLWVRQIGQDTAYSIKRRLTFTNEMENTDEWFTLNLSIRKSRGKWFANLNANPTRLASGQNVKPCRWRSLQDLMMLPWLTLTKVLAIYGFQWSRTTRNKLQAGDLVIHDFSPDFYIPAGAERKKLLFYIYRIYGTAITNGGGDDDVSLARALNADVRAYRDDAGGELTSVLLTKRRGANIVCSIMFYLKDVQVFSMTAGSKTDTVGLASDGIRLSCNMRSPAIKELMGSCKLSEIARWFEDLGEDEAFTRIKNSLFRRFKLEHFLCRDWEIDGATSRYAQYPEFEDQEMIAAAQAYARRGKPVKNQKLAARIYEIFGWDTSISYKAHMLASYARTHIFTDLRTAELTVKVAAGHTGADKELLKALKSVPLRLKAASSGLQTLLQSDLSSAQNYKPTAIKMPMSLALVKKLEHQIGKP